MVLEITYKKFGSKFVETLKGVLDPEICFYKKTVSIKVKNKFCCYYKVFNIKKIINIEVKEGDGHESSNGTI